MCVWEEGGRGEGGERGEGVVGVGVVVGVASVCSSSRLDVVRLVHLSAVLSWYSFTPLGRIRLHSASHLLFNPPSTVFCGACPSLHVFCTLSSAPEHVPPSPASPCSPCPSSQLLLSDALHPCWHRLRSCATEPPQSSPDCIGPHLSLAVFLPTVLEPNAISVPHDDFSRGCLDPQVHAILPRARQLSKADLLLISSSTRPLLRRTSLVSSPIFISLAQTLFLPPPTGLRTLSTRIRLVPPIFTSPFFFNRAAYLSEKMWRTT